MKEKEIRTLKDRLSATGISTLRIQLTEKSRIEVAEDEKHRVYILEGTPTLAEFEGGRILPTLESKSLEKMPRIIVDMGAVPHVCNGADVMAPGIVSVDGAFQQGDLVVVVDQRNNKPLALGLSLLSANELKQTKKGKVLTNIHYVGDELWKKIRSLK